MKARNIVKKSVTLEDIYEDIKSASEDNAFKVFFHHAIYVSDDVKLELIDNGFKIYEGRWDAFSEGLIIEW